MRYSVGWTEDAAADLWELWSSPAERAAVTAAALLIDQLLEQNPLDERHEVVNGLGTAIRAPIGVDFSVDVPGRRVLVTAAWPVSEDK